MAAEKTGARRTNVLKKRLGQRIVISHRELCGKCRVCGAYVHRFREPKTLGSAEAAERQ